MNPEFSIVIPVYNGEFTLKQCLDSIFNQTHQDYEVIVVDNNSTDRTKLICQDFSKVQYVFCKNKGRSIARNSGAQQSSSKYLVFIDCDIILPSDWLSKVRSFLHSYPVDILATSIVPQFEDNKNVVDKYRYNFGEYKSHGTFLSLQKFFGVMPVINTAACVCLASSFHECNGFNEDLKRNEDLDLSLRMFLKGYSLGGVLAAKSSVRFITKNRTFDYLYRNYERAANNMIIESPLNKVLISTLKRFSKKNDWQLFLYVCLLELANLMGFISAKLNFSLHENNRKIRSQWVVSSAKKMFRFSFMHDKSLYFLHPSINLIFIDDVVFQVSTNFQSTPLDNQVSSSCQKLLRKETLQKEEMETLVNMGLFIHG